jgi:ribosomal protein L37AE/L43A
VPRREVCSRCPKYREVTLSRIAATVFWSCERCGVQTENDAVNRECPMRLEQFVAIGRPMRLNAGRTFVADEEDASASTER